MTKFKIILPLLVFLLSFGIYIFTLNPSISAADSNEIVTTAIVLGIPHQPSYPINTLIGHLFSKIPFGTLPWRVNLLSAFLQATTVTLIYFVVIKLFKLALTTSQRSLKSEESGIGNQESGGENQKSNFHNSLSTIHDSNFLDPKPYTLIPYHILAAAASLFLAFSLEFWQFATRAEVFPLNNLFGAASTLILVLWWEKVEKLGSRVQGLGFGNEEDNPVPYTLHPKPLPSPSRKTLQKYAFFAKHLPEEARRRLSAYQPPVAAKIQKGSLISFRLLYLFTFVSGFAFAHHQTIVLLAPAFLFLLFNAGFKFWFKKEVLLKLALCFILGFLPYFSLIPMSRANPPVEWGDPSSFKGVFKALTRSDYGTFSPYAQNPADIEGTTPKETPVTQQLFYFESLSQDFSFLGIVLSSLGAFYLFRKKKRIFILLFLSFFFSGPFFLGFANYNLDSGFHQAVAKRFQMLPDLFFTLFLAFGFFFIWEKFQSLKLDFKDKKNVLARFFIIAGLFLTVLYPFLRNFKYADNRHNDLTISYARDSLTSTPKDAIILISGDVTTFAFEYWQTLVDKDNERIIFSPGLLYLDWYVARLKKNHPEVILPPTKPGRLQPSTTEIIDANWGKRPIYISPELSRYDPMVGEKYTLWPKHLLFLVKKRGEDLRLEPYREENDALWESYDLSLFERVRKNNPLLEYAMVPEYARHYFNIGAVFENVHLYDDAILNYDRALKIHPGFPDPYKNLGRVYGFELKNKDRQKAWQNFQMFLTTALPSQQEDVKAVYAAMGQLQEDAVREATMAAKSTEATESGLPIDKSGKTITPSTEGSSEGKKK